MDNVQLMDKLKKAQPVLWLNEGYRSVPLGEQEMVSAEEVAEAQGLWRRFAPLLAQCFVETAPKKGAIRSPLVEIEAMRQGLSQWEGAVPGRLLLKMDSHLPIAGSVKARGGVFEVLHFTEQLAINHNLVTKKEDYRSLLQHKNFFGEYTIQVGSTGNLGLSIGTMAAALGYRVVVHMSAEAKAWKKKLLRDQGVIVKEYLGDYTMAVEAGRQLAATDPKSHFVDDEQSRELFLGYATAAEEIRQQLHSMQIEINAAQPLVVYLPCGVGGAPGGIAFGLKNIFGEHVHCFFVEPTQCPCMLLGMASGRYEDISITDMGLAGQTAADGLAVGRPSPLVSAMMKQRISGIFSVTDEALFRYLALLHQTEGINIEPSACAGFAGVVRMVSEGEGYLRNQGVELSQAIQLVWATGGALVPFEEMQGFIHKGEALLKQPRRVEQ